MADLSLGSSAQTLAPLEGVPLVQGERKIVTILFADIVNSTGLAEQLDPEDWTEVMNGAFERLTGPVTRYGGTVGRLMGDGMLAFFGFPTSHEDDPHRAVMAGLAIVGAIRDYRQQMTSSKLGDLDVRVGINTGSVVIANVGSSALSERTAMGDAVNVAARMQQTASPGTVQITADTHGQIASRFEFAPLGRIMLKGKADSVEVYRVIRPLADPVEPLTDQVSLAPLIGRERELGILRAAVDEVREGRGSIIGLIGEAGLGKSRLLSELHRYWVERDPESLWETMLGIPYDSSRPFAMFQNHARRMFGVELDDDGPTIHHKVKDALTSLGFSEETFAMCAVAMERVIAAKVLHEAQDYSGTEIKDDIYLRMYPAFRESANQGRFVLVVDDLQWSDEASIGLLIHLLPLVEEVPMLVIFASRPERQSPAWRVKIAAETDYPHRYQEIVLGPLDARDSGALVDSLLEVSGLPVDVKNVIVRKTDGNPYFLEEVVRSLVGQGVVEAHDGRLVWRPGAALSDIVIPDSLQALLVARMDELDQETRTTLQMASVIGRSFYYRILLAISDSANAIDKHLRSLERVEFLREGRRRPELEYIFKHELARDAAYATILHRKRREFHLHVAEAMEQIFADRLEEHAHRLAQHFEQADDRRAVKYYGLAADLAFAIGAPAEGRDHLGRAVVAAERLDVSGAELPRLRERLSTAVDAYPQV